MAFLETPPFQDNIARDFTGGPEFRVDIVVKGGGYEDRDRVWQQARRNYDAASAINTLDTLQYIEDLFYACGGPSDGFRLRDWGDYTALVSNGLMQPQIAGVDYGTGGVGYGLPAMQLVKRYTRGANTHDRRIRKPRTGTVTIYRGGVLQTAGVAAGNYALATDTGIVTFVADASSAASSITVGATTQVILTTNPGTLIAGQRLYLSGFTGADAASVNGLSHLINTVTGSGPYTFTLATVTTGMTITLGSGAGAKYAQASEALTWAGQFDVPVRFNTNRLDRRLMTMQENGGFIVQYASIPLIEIRT
jgi:uncharacterized protein (TIGR02217 family)